VSFFQDRNQQVGTDRRPDLDPNRVVGVTDKAADTQVLLDPAKEQFDLPPSLIDFGDFEGGQGEVVRQEDQGVFTFGIEKSDTPKTGRIILLGKGSTKPNGLIASKSCVSVDGATLGDIEAKIGLCPDHKIGAFISESPQASEIYVSTIHYIDGAWFYGQVVENIDLVNRALCQSEKRGYWTAKIKECMQFNGRFSRAKVGPRKQTQAQIDDCGIQSINGLVEFECEGLIRVEFARSTNQALRPVRKDPPVSNFVRIGQSAAAKLRSKPHLIQKFRSGAKRRLQVPQALTKGELRKCHRKPLIMASKMYNAEVPTITIDAATKRFPVPQTEHLRKHGLRSHPVKIPVFWPDRMQNASHLKKRIKK